MLSGLQRTSIELPAWPVVLLIGGLPLWWVTGLLPFVSIPLAVAMLLILLSRSGVLLVPGVLPWLAFVAWVAAAVVMIDSPERLIGYSLRFGQWVAAAVLLVYVVNARHSLPLRRIVGVILVVWATMVVGGFLGLLFPEVRLATPVSMVLPAGLASNEFVQDLVSPQFAQIQQPWGAEEPFIRPSAPFTYANSWGAAFAVLTPIAIASLFMFRSTRARLLIGLGLALSLVPALATSNRGMFIALGVTLLYGTFRLALRGARGAVLALIVLAVGAAVALGVGVFEGISERQEVADTTEGRSRLYLETFVRTLGSPLLGYGAPRPSNTLEISVGTQGQIWFLMFSFGFVGLFLFLLFLWGGAFRTRHARGPEGLWLHAVLVGTSVMVLYYGLDSTITAVIVLVTAALLRERYLPEREKPGGVDPPVTRGVTGRLPASPQAPLGA